LRGGGFVLAQNCFEPRDAFSKLGLALLQVADLGFVRRREIDALVEEDQLKLGAFIEAGQASDFGVLCSSHAGTHRVEGDEAKQNDPLERIEVRRTMPDRVPRGQALLGAEVG
jgi:hypothetical protein